MSFDLSVHSPVRYTGKQDESVGSPPKEPLYKGRLFTPDPKEQAEENPSANYFCLYTKTRKDSDHSSDAKETFPRLHKITIELYNEAKRVSQSIARGTIFKSMRREVISDKREDRSLITEFREFVKNQKTNQAKAATVIFDKWYAEIVKPHRKHYQEQRRVHLLHLHVEKAFAYQRSPNFKGNDASVEEMEAIASDNFLLLKKKQVGYTIQPGAKQKAIEQIKVKISQDPFYLDYLAYIETYEHTEKALKSKALKVLRKEDAKFWDLLDDHALASIQKFKTEFEAHISSNLYAEARLLMDEYSKHALLRFEKFIQIHSDFTYRSLIIIDTLSENPEGKKLFISVFKNIISSFMNIYDNGFRDIQGSHKNHLDPHHGQAQVSECSKAFSDKFKALKIGFSTEFIQTFLIELQDAHTIPFPGIFSWNFRKIGSLKVVQEAGISFNTETIKTVKVSKVIHTMTREDIDTAFAEELRMHLQECDQDTKKFIADALYFLHQPSLFASSETQHLPTLCNKVDGVTEERIVTFRKDISQGLSGLCNHHIDQSSKTPFQKHEIEREAINAFTVYLLKSKKSILKKVESLKSEPMNLEILMQLSFLNSLYISLSYTLLKFSSAKEIAQQEEEFLSNIPSRLLQKEASPKFGPAAASAIAASSL